MRHSDPWRSLLQNAIVKDERRKNSHTRPRRSPRGTAKYITGAPKNAKLSWSKVRNIRTRHFDENWTVQQLCAEYEVSTTTMKNIITYQSWVPK